MGVEYNAVEREVGPLATLFLLTETETRPALFLGTSSDRIGSPEGKQAYYATGSKYVPALRSSFNVTLNYSEWDESVNVPFGGAFEIGRGLGVRYMYDGERSHLLLDLFRERVGASLMAVWMETFGIALYGGI